MTFVIGIPKEIKANEFRVSLIPNDVKKLVDMGFKVYVEKNAGIGAIFTNEDYLNVGAEICENSREVFQKANIIIKVKELLNSEFPLVKEHHIILTFFHFASLPDLINAMLLSKSICIAYETIRTDEGIYPILAPMSKIAGEQALLTARDFIEEFRGVNRDYKEDVITIIGFGNVGKASYLMAKKLGYRNINLMDKDFDKLKKAKEDDSSINIYEMTNMNLIDLLKISSIIIGSIYKSGEKADKLIINDMLKIVKEKSIIIDVAIDQGGITEQSKPMTIYEPIIKYDKANIYCVSNIPSIVPHKASIELSGAIYPYLEEILKDMDIEKTIERNVELKRGVNIYKGQIWNEGLIFI